MAYDPTIPDLDHYIEDDIPAIRANFAELGPLVPHIATLVDLTTLQPYVAELVDLTALQPHIAELVDLTALQPHIAEILNSRVVDHNLDVANPPNGWYARYEDGRQKVWVTGSLVYFTTRALNVVGTMPAEFTRVMSFGGSWINGSGFVGAVRREEIGPLYMHAVTNTGYQLRVIRMEGGTNSFASGDELPFLASFEGMWK